MTGFWNNPILEKSLESLAVIGVVGLVYYTLRALLKKRGHRASERLFALRYTALALVCLGLVFIWLEGLGPIFTALTIIAAGLTITAKEIILNILTSLIIAWRELFAIGDRVRVQDVEGDVMDKGLFFFTLLEVGGPESSGHSTGRLVKVPNLVVLTNPVYNHTRAGGQVWNEIRLGLSLSSDWEKGRGILLKIAGEYLEEQQTDLEQLKREFEKKNIFFRELAPLVYVSLASGHIRLILRYLCDSRRIRAGEDFILSRFLQHLEPGVLELAQDG